ncbi:hypothetical protein Syun_008656 [Stephania yunnanensis]|uniref:RING-type E3 ubiquitin transferase n=1 Tax=Stephania yunnanensis TaxID=152371 RepID=A0AAP0KFL5_9MAGN
MDPRDDDGYNWNDYQRHRERFGLNTRIMLTAIISLLFVIVMVVLLHLYARLVLKRQARRRQAMLQMGIGLNSSALQSIADPPRTGLDQSIISSLPIFIYKRASSQDQTSSSSINSIECSVCLSTIEEEEMVRLLPNCKHTFHSQCIDMWLNGHSTCPVCRTEAEPRSQAQPQLLVTVVPGTAPPMETVNSSLPGGEGTSDLAVQTPGKVTGSSLRLSSFRRMLSRERSERRVINQPTSCEQGDHHHHQEGDLERQ